MCLPNLLHVSGVYMPLSTACRTRSNFPILKRPLVDLFCWILFIKSNLLGFPGGAVVESLPASAGDAGSSPGLGGSHVPRSGWAREPRLLSLRVWSLCSATGEAVTVRGPRTVVRSGPRLPRLGKALAQRRRPSIAINQSIN